MDLGRKKKSVISSVWAILGVSFLLSCLYSTPAWASTVDSISGTPAATLTSHAYQRKAFYANGRYWVFYSNGTDMKFKSSTDGNTWDTSGTARTTCTDGQHFSVATDGTYVHYAYGPDIVDIPLKYRRGLLISDGTITWDSEQNAFIDDSTSYQSFPMIALDSGGYPWIGWHRYRFGHYGYVTKSSTNNGTWTTASGFPYDVGGGFTHYSRFHIVPLTNLKVYVIYSDASNQYGVPDIARGRLYNSGWGSAENVSSSNLQDGAFSSAVNEGDDVHFLYLCNGCEANYLLRYRKRTYGTGWGTEVSVSSSSMQQTTGPVLSRDTVNNTLYAFWTGHPSGVNRIYYSTNSGSGWASEQSWVNESTDLLSSYNSLTSFYKDYSGHIGVVYMAKTGATKDIRFAEWRVTAVGLKSFHAYWMDEGILLDWRTYYEVRNLGFNVYREEGGQLLRLNPEIVAGSALWAGSSATPNPGRRYHWWDTSLRGQLSAVGGQRSARSP